MRRALPPFLLAAIGVLLWVAGPALATPRAQDFEMAVPSGSAHAASAVIRAPKRFDLVGARWTSPKRVTIDLRARRDGRSWSRWVRMDGAEMDSTRGTEPVWTGDADELQLRVHGRVRGLRLHFVRATGAAKPIAHRAQEGQPAMVTRDQWGADQCPPRVAPSFGTVDLALVHHTVTANDYQASDSAALVLAICRYHRNSNGWNDIGYNFLVDRFGTIFEGRAGGAQAAVIGAQAQGYNSHSTGIAVLGTQETVPASDPTMQSLAKLIAWKLPFHGTPVSGKVTVTSGGGSLNRYPAGREIVLDRISGHRDVDSTACPGGALYAQLPQLRSMVAARVTPAPALSLAAASAEVAYPGTAALSGRLTLPDGSAVAGAPVQVQRLGSTGFKTVRTVATAADGTWSIAIPTSVSRVFRAVSPGDATRGAGRSPQVAISVMAQLTARLKARRVVAGRAAVLTGTLRPSKPAVRVTVEFQRGGIFKRVRTVRIPVVRSRFRLALPLRTRGLYRLTVRFAGDPSNAAVAGQPLTVRAVAG